MGLAIQDTKVQHCQTAAEVRALNRAVLERKRERRRPPRRIPINDLTPIAFQIPIQRSEVSCREWLPPVAAPTISSIIDVVCRVYGVSRMDIVSARRTKDVVLPRQIAGYLAAKLTPHSLPTIAQHLGGRDHTTLVHARQKIIRMRETDPAFDNELYLLEEKLGGCPQIKIRGGPWAAYPQMDDRLIALATTTLMPLDRIATTLNREYGASLSREACYARLRHLGVRAADRRSKEARAAKQASLIMEAA